LQSNVCLCLDCGGLIIAANSPLPGKTAGQLGGSYDRKEQSDPTISSIEGMVDAVHFQ
jgi:hypothetical protein